MKYYSEKIDLKLFSEFYENYAALMHEDSSIIAGLLVGLNVIDFNIPMKDINLDTQV